MINPSSLSSSSLAAGDAAREPRRGGVRAVAEVANGARRREADEREADGNRGTYRAGHRCHRLAGWTTTLVTP